MNIRNLVRLLIFALALLLAGCLTSCKKDGPEAPPPDWWQNQGGDNDKPGQDENGLYRLADADNIVCAHRGGSTEADKRANPDNSIAALRYAMSLGIYASECDIYWTKDDNVVVAHADGECRINGLYPWESTVDELRKAGTLDNGEQIPTLGEYIDVLLKESKCTRLWLDIKNITKPSSLTQYPINAAKRACEIISEKEANNCVEFICTGNGTVMAAAWQHALKEKISIGWMGNQPQGTYAANGYTWANLSYEYMAPNYPDGEGSRTVEEFTGKGVDFSIFVIDDPDAMDFWIGKAKGNKHFKAICTNYPKRLLNKMNAGK